MWSDAEERLLKSLGYEIFIERSMSVAPDTAYREMSLKCFIEEINDERAASVRRCLKAMGCAYGFPRTHNRCTPEVDALITV